MLKKREVSYIHHLVMFLLSPFLLKVFVSSRTLCIMRQTFYSQEKRWPSSSGNQPCFSIPAHSLLILISSPSAKCLVLTNVRTEVLSQFPVGRMSIILSSYRFLEMANCHQGERNIAIKVHFDLTTIFIKAPSSRLSIVIMYPYNTMLKRLICTYSSWFMKMSEMRDVQQIRGKLLIIFTTGCTFFRLC